MAFWVRGQMTQLSKMTGIPSSIISRFFKKSIGVGRDRAKKLKAACDELGLDIPLDDIIFNKESKHPAFIDYSKFKSKEEAASHEDILK